MASISMENSVQVVQSTQDARIAMMPGSRRWNTFLVDLYDKLSVYDIQKDRNNYNVADVEYWGESGKEQGIRITESNFGQFINKTAQYDIREYESIRDIAITEPQLRDLNHILNLTLKHEVTKSCSIPNELVIKGGFVKFSDFIGDDGNLTVNEGCKNLTAINIFSRNTVFADRDVILTGRKIDLIIISPKWVIISTRIIDLSGAKGKDIIRAERRPNGTDGEPGLPGGRGGNFFGIGREFINGKNFTIIANGGAGGAGDDGEDGENGLKGARDLQLPNYEIYCPNFCNKGRIFIDTNGTVWHCSNLGRYEIYTREYTGYRYMYSFGNTNGDDGGNGGNGGKGGRGGNSGNIELCELNDYSGISKQNDIGKNGENGRGGKGGDGGTSADYSFVNCDVHENHDYSKLIVAWDLRKNITFKNGLNGIDGANERGIRDPEPGTVLKPAAIMNKYKYYLRENLNDRFQKYALIEFLPQLYNHKTIKSAYDTLELFNELKDLEEQLHYINQHVNVVTLYQSLLNSISEYAEKPKAIENSRQYKKILTYMYTATLGRITYFNDPSESSLIIDMEKHLSLIKTDIESMRNLQISSRKTDLINDYKKNYKRDIDRQINEAVYAIERLITPSLNNITTRIDDRIASLIGEIREMERLAENEKRQLIDEQKQLGETMKKLTEEEERKMIAKRGQLQKAMLWKGLFGGLRIVGKIARYFGPIGSAVAKVIAWTSDPVEAWLVGDEVDKRQSLKSDIQTYTKQIETAKNEKLKHLNDLLEVISQEIRECPEKFGDTAVKIDEMKSRLNEDGGNKFDRIKGIENQLKSLLKRKGEELTGSAENMNNDAKTLSAIAAARKMKQAVQIYGVGFDIYNKFKKEQADLNAISAAIAQESRIIDKLQNNEKNINDITIPMLQKMEENLRGIVNELDTKSGISLDVAKWQVQSVLKDLKFHMKQLTRMVDDLHDDLPHSVEMLEDAITALINIYDRIQDYEREEKFVNFYTDMSRISGGDGNITDSRLSNAINVDYLESLIRSNHVIMKYKVAIEGFKNFVFPLAHVYLKNFALPSHFQLENNFENLLSTATTQIEHVKSKLAMYKTYLNGAGYNPYIKVAPFTSFYASTEPFYVWKNAEYKDLIGKLLNGERVTVRSDVIAAPAYRDAIKFSVAVFYFKALNQTMQAEINSALRGFEIEATHLGDSHYRCNDTIYRIISNNMTISYYLEKRPDGQPVSTSLTYVGLKEKDSILSPYATWEVTLLSSTNRVSHRDLDKYKDVVDLELMGDGSYIDNRRVDYSRLNIKKYYRDIGTYNHNDMLAEQETINTSNATSNRRNARSVDAPNYYRIPKNASIDIPSVIVNASNFVRKTVSMINTKSTVEKFVNWLGMDTAGEEDREASGDFDIAHDNLDIAGFNRDTVFSGPPVGSTADQFTNGFIDSDNNSIKVVNFDSFDKNGNLLLLDMVFRKKNSNNYKNYDNSFGDHSDTEYAQNLAYSAYAPKNMANNDDVTTDNFII